MPAIQFQGWESGPNFDRAREQMATEFLSFDIALDNATSNYILNASGDFLYVDVASTGYADMEFNNQWNDAGAKFRIQGNFATRNVVFKQLKLSWPSQPGKFLRIHYSTGGEVIPANTGVSAVTISGSPTVQTSDKLLNRYTASGVIGFSNRTLLSALTPLQICAPSSNVNGLIVRNAFGGFSQTNGQCAVLIAKSSAPTTLNDGDVLASAVWVGFGTRYDTTVIIKLESPVFVAAGKGLYFMTQSADDNSLPTMKSCTYELL